MVADRLASPLFVIVFVSEDAFLNALYCNVKYLPRPSPHKPGSVCGNVCQTLKEMILVFMPGTSHLRTCAV